MEAKCPECDWVGYWKETIGGDNWCPNCLTHCVEDDDFDDINIK